MALCLCWAQRRDLAIAGWLLLSLPLAACEESPGSCWSIGFTHDLCCSPEHGPEGNPSCWDDVYTHDACCKSDDGDPSLAGCAGPSFERFRRFVRDFYLSGRLRPGLVEAWPRLLANFDARLRLCAPAALQASLLRIEEHGQLELAESTLQRLAAYAMALQRGAEQGLLRPEDLAQWPLEQGVARIQEESQQRVRRLRSRGHPDVTLIISYCRERLYWVNASTTRRYTRHVDLTIVLKCPGVATDTIVQNPRAWRSVRYLEIEDLPLRADECSAYFGYLYARYDDLPQHMVFIHADAPEHVGLGRPNILDDTLRALVHGTSIPFGHLGNNRITMAWKEDAMTVLWRGLFGSSFSPGPDSVRTYCCSHFVVSRERVRLRSRQFYAEALDFITSTRSYSYLPVSPGYTWPEDLKGRLACQNMMFLWHVIFGEPLDQPHRMLDPHLPLFLKVRNIRTAYMDLE